MATVPMRIGLILNAINRMGPGVNGAIGMLGKVAGAVGLVTLAYKGFDAITQYDDAIQSLSAVTGVSGSALSDMKVEVMSLAKESKKSGYEIAQAFENVGSNMSEYLKDPKGLRDITAAGVVLSKAARMEVAPALDNLTTIMNQFDLKAKDAAKSVNILTAGEIVGNVRTAQISAALQDFGASAAGAKVSLGESVAMIEVLGKKLKAEQIGVAGRNILVALSAAKGLPREAQKYLEAYGVSTKKLMDPNTKLITRLKELSKISGDATAMVKVFGKENITAATILLKNLPLYENWEGQIQNTNEAQNQANTNTASFTGKMNALKASFDNVLIAENENAGALGMLGSIIVFAANNMAILLNILVIGMATYAGFAIYAASANAILKAQAIWTKAATAAQWLWNIAMTANPIGLIIVGVAALIALLVGLVVYWDEVTAALKKFGKFLLSAVLTPIIWVLKALGKLTGAKWAINMAANMEQMKGGLDATASSPRGGTTPGLMTNTDALKSKASNNTSSFNYNPVINLGNAGPQEQAAAKGFLDRDFKQKLDQVKSREKRLSYSE